MDEKTKKRLVEMANAWREDVVDAGRLPLVVEEHDVVIGIWKEADGDVGYLIIKGESELHSIVKKEKAAPTRVTAIPFMDPEEAAAARNVFGDFRRAREPARDFLNGRGGSRVRAVT